MVPTPIQKYHHICEGQNLAAAAKAFGFFFVRLLLVDAYDESTRSLLSCTALKTLQRHKLSPESTLGPKRVSVRQGEGAVCQRPLVFLCPVPFCSYFVWK